MILVLGGAVGFIVAAIFIPLYTLDRKYQMIATDSALEFFLADRSKESRDVLVSHYAYLCSRAARKFLRPGLERADLQQIAAIGLLKACDRYDTASRTPFEAFAWLLIVGELMHFVRDHERLVRPPRRLRELERRLHSAYDLLIANLGREPSIGELARHLNVPSRDVEEVSAYRERAIPESLHDLKPHQLHPCCYPAEEPEGRVMLEQALRLLTNLERTIIYGVYGKGYSQIEIASRLGYSRRTFPGFIARRLRK